MAGFLTNNNNPTSASHNGFASYDSTTCTIVDRSTSTVLAARGDEIEIEIGAMRWRYTPRNLEKGAKAPPFQVIPDGNPELIPSIPPDHIFEVAVRMTVGGQAWLLTSGANGFKSGLNPLYDLYSRGGPANALVKLLAGTSTTWTPSRGHGAGVARTDIVPVFKPVSTTVAVTASPSTNEETAAERNARLGARIFGAKHAA